MTVLYPSWQPAFFDAFKELNGENLSRKIEDAEDAIVKRLFDIDGVTDHAAEREAIEQAIEFLSVLKHAVTRPPANHDTS
jgi:hypothetical protein